MGHGGTRPYPVWALSRSEKNRGLPLNLTDARWGAMSPGRRSRNQGLSLGNVQRSTLNAEPGALFLESNIGR